MMVRYRLIACVALSTFATGCLSVRLDRSGIDKAVFENGIDEGVFSPQVDYSDPVLKNRKIIVNSDINALVARHVVSKLFFLNQESEARPIDLYLNTDGGSFDDSMSICEAIRAIKAPVNVWAFVDVRSAGISILMSATGHRIATPNSVFLIHGPRISKNTPERYVEIMTECYINPLKERTTLPKKWFPLAAGTIHVLNANEALKYGLVDRVLPNKPSEATSQ